MEYSPNRAAEFEFVSRTVAEDGTLAFSYRVHFSGGESLDFAERITLSEKEWQKHLPQEFVDAILEDLHLILGTSYYKLFCPPTFKTDIKLSEEQAAFWNTVYTKGLGEFLYRNNIDASRVAQFTATEGYQRNGETLTSDIRKTLIGIGGGKDSVVSLELLNEYERTGLIVETGKENAIARDIAHVADVSLQTISRTLDPQLLEGVPGSYSGHVPISLVYAFLGVLEAAIGGHAWVVVSNEYSSSIGSIVEDGREVNHQWSKSLECEQLVQKYMRGHLTPSIQYFSLLRPFYELRIVKMFVELGGQYFKVFSSCNKNFAHDYKGPRWCGECAKCAFAFLMLAAFLDKEQVVQIFGKNLFEDEALLPLYKDLLGLGHAKPFDCVGTSEESQTALILAGSRWKDTLLVRELDSQCREFSEVMRVQQALTMPSRFRLLGMETALILGYAREGQVSELFLKKYYPHVHIDHSDKKDGDDYLKKQEDFDIVVKTAGIPSTLVTRQYTTATQMFFSLVPRERIIGVTGSTGKSTTATLIYEVLAASGLNARLVGNIGTPALSCALEEKHIEKDTLFVFELSSFQLADLDVSPHIAVVTSLFPEHIDYHKTTESYYDAKRNIFRFQDHDDVLVVEAQCVDTMVPSDETVLSTVIPVRAENITYELTIPGEHSRRNAACAAAVARVLDVPDDSIKETTSRFKGVAGRLQFVREVDGIAFYNDTAAVTPDATIAALEMLKEKGNIILIMGGSDKGVDMTQLLNAIPEYTKAVVLLAGTGTDKLLKTHFSLNADQEPYSDLRLAVEGALHVAEKGDVILLSPGFASFGMFRDMDDRGEQFNDIVKHL